MQIKPTAASHPRWVNLLRETVNKNMAIDKGSISYAIATLDDGVTSPAPNNPAPRVRFVVHRGFVNERREGEDPTWSGNEANDATGQNSFSDCMMVTTDVRAPKALQISANLAGGLLELAWWFAPTAQQFRIRGRSYIYAKEGHPINAPFPISRLSPPGIAPFNFDEERKRIFRKMSPQLRASYCRPTPGTPLNSTNPPIDPHDFPTALPVDLAPGVTDKERMYLTEAMTNMSLIVIEPFEVDWCDLSTEPNQRVRWTKTDGVWSEVNVVP